MKPSLCFGGLALSFALAGCTPELRLATNALRKISQSTARTQTAINPTIYVQALTPQISGAGLVVFDAVCDAPADHAFAAGLTRWLHLHSAGQPAFGQTAPWGMFRNLEGPLGVSNARLGGKKAVEGAKYLGATHFVTSRLRRLSAGKFRLELSLNPTKTPAKTTTLQAAGTEAEIITALPSLAAQLVKTVGGKAVALPKTALSPADFALLGKYPHKLKYEETVAPADAKRLLALQAKDALAALVAGRLAFGSQSDSGAWFENARILARLAPQNSLAWSDIANQDEARLTPYATSIEKLAAKYPRNALLAFTEMKLADEKNNDAVEVQHAERAVRAAPRNSLMWQFLADAHGDQAQNIRRSRYSRDIKSSEWQKLDAIYANGYASALQATQLAPKDALAWADLADAATFVDTDLGLAALDTALKLDPNNPLALSWGMQLTQTKWTGDIEKYVAFARDAATRADKFDFNAFHVINVLREAGRTQDLVWILETAHKKAPKNASVSAELGQWYHYNDRNYAKARPLYKSALQIDPRNASALNGLADLTYFLDSNNVEAERLYRLAYKLRPDGYNAANLGRFLALTGRKSEGVKMANEAKSLGFSDANHQVWGATGVSP